MCYYVASKLSGKEIFQLEHDFVAKWEEEEERGDYYVANGWGSPKLPVITSEHRFHKLQWGLLPHWFKDSDPKKIKSIQGNCLNAISEEIEAKPSYRDAVKANQFCILPINGFFEWHTHLNNEKYPFFIYPKTQPLFYFAAVYSLNNNLGDERRTFTVLTTRANERMAWIHNTKKRMPVILTLDDSKVWLDSSISFKDKKHLCEPFDQNLMLDHSISRLITSRKENPNQPGVIEKVEYPELIGY